MRRMSGLPYIVAELRFLMPGEGGRETSLGPPWMKDGSGGYMPHVVVENQSEYLGVRFVDGPTVIGGKPQVFRLQLAYFPRMDYSALKVGVAIEVREGGNTVARGRVLERVEES